MPTRSRMRLWSGAARDKFATAGASSSRGAMPSGGSNDRCALIMLGDANCSTSYSRSICRLFLDPAKIVPCNEIGNDIDGGYVQADLDADPGDYARQMSKPGWLEFDGGAALEVRSRFKNPIGDLERCARALPLAPSHPDPASKAKPRQSAYRRRPASRARAAATAMSSIAASFIKRSFRPPTRYAIVESHPCKSPLNDQSP
jgi:hypothetical protein